MTIPELEQNLLAAVAELKEERRQLKPLATEWALADTEYRKAHAIAFSAGEGTVPERKGTADRAASREMQHAHNLEALREAVKENVRAIQAEISAYQTLAGLLKSEMALDGRYET